MARRKNDAYFTLDNLAAAICYRVASAYPELGATPHICEPAAGGGVFVKAARERWGPGAAIVAIDIDPTFEVLCKSVGADGAVTVDFLRVDPAALEDVDLFLGNPPYKLAEKFVRHCLACNPKALVAFLLPVGFLGSQERWLPDKKKKNAGKPLYTHAAGIDLFASVVPRPSFTGNGKTDRMEYGLFVFRAISGEVAAWRISPEPLVWGREPPAADAP